MAAVIEMLDIFYQWLLLKSSLHVSSRKMQFKQGDIWWCSIGMNLGEEVFGKGSAFTRPVLIFRKFTANSFLGLPLTRKGKDGTWYVPLMIRGQRSYVLLNQARVLDKKRLTNRIVVLEESDFKRVQEAFLVFYSS